MNQDVLRFWGVRGSIPTPGPDTLKYGGNTTCVEINLNKTRFIIDAGSGIRALGQTLLKEMPLTAHLFFTHYHWDHIQGFPFFTPAYVPGNSLNIYGPDSVDGRETNDILYWQMNAPYFPVPMPSLASDQTYTIIEHNDTIEIEGVTITSKLLNHSEYTVGYRFEYKSTSIAFISDTEHFLDKLDENVLELAKDADIVIYDSMYTDEEYHSETSSKVGWGHSTWQEAIKVVKAANAKHLILFHHDPTRSDQDLEAILEQAKKQFPSTSIATEGEEICL